MNTIVETFSLVILLILLILFILHLLNGSAKDWIFSKFQVDDLGLDEAGDLD